MGKLKLKEVKKFNLGYIAKSGVEVKLEFKIFQFQDSYISNPPSTSFTPGSQTSKT